MIGPSPWIDRPVGRVPTLILVILLCAAPAWLMADALRSAIVLGDDFAYLSASRTWARCVANLGTPHNVHVAPLFRLWTFGLVWLAGRLDRLPTVLVLASYAALVLVMLAGGHLVARESGSMALGLAAMAALGLTTVVERATAWYSAGQVLWAGLGILLMLVALQDWRARGGAWRLAFAFVAAVAAALSWTGGYAAGPVGAAYLWADGRPRARAVSLVLIVATAVAGCVFLALVGRRLSASDGLRDGSPPTTGRVVTTLAHTGQTIPELMVLANLGLDAPTTATQGAVLTLILAGLWAETVRRGGWPGPLETAGLALMATSLLMVFAFRGGLPFSSLRTLDWYYVIPHDGFILTLFGLGIRLVTSQASRDIVCEARGGTVQSSGQWSGEGATVQKTGQCHPHAPHLPGEITRPSSPTIPRPLTRRGALAMVGLATVLLILHAPRAARLVAGDAEQVRAQRLFLARLDEAQRIARRDGIGREAIRATFGRIIGPGVAAQVPHSDAANLLDLPHAGRVTDPTFVRAALNDVLGPYAEGREADLRLRGPGR
jgi:hypothetical protein